MTNLTYNDGFTAALDAIREFAIEEIDNESDFMAILAELDRLYATQVVEEVREEDTSVEV